MVIHLGGGNLPDLSKFLSLLSTKPSIGSNFNWRLIISDWLLKISLNKKYTAITTSHYEKIFHTYKVFNHFDNTHLNLLNKIAEV